MFRISSSWALKGAFALCLCAGPACATTITSGGSYALTPLNTYVANDGFIASPGVFTHTYEFVYSPPPGLAAPLSVTTNNNNGVVEIPTLAIDWYKTTTSSVALVADSIVGAGVATDNLTLTGAGNYFLVLSGDVTGLLGLYTLTVSTGKALTQLTPLPGALVLFGSALTGGVVLLRRRRSAVQKMPYGLAA